MTSSPDRDARDRAAAAGAVVDVAAVQAGLPARAAADARGVRAVAAGRAARRAAGAVAQAARQGRRSSTDRGLVQAAAIGLGVSATATWFLRTVSTRVQRRFRDKVTIALESHVARLQASIATIAHQERPEYLDRLSMLRNQVFVLDHMYMSLFSRRAAGSCAWASRWRCWCRFTPRSSLLAVFAMPTVLTSTWRPGVERTAQERGAQASRLAGICSRGDDRAARQGSARHRHRRALVARAARGLGALVRAGRRGPLGVGLLARAGLGGLRRRVRRRGRVRLVRPRAPAGDVLLVLAAGARLSAYIGATVGEIGFLRGFWMDGSRRLAWLEDYAASVAASADLPAPAVAAPRHPVRPRVVRLSRHVACSCSTTSRSRCRPARSSRSSARTAPARRRW